MELTEQQKTVVGQWVMEGCGLSEIQRRLASEFDMRATFMDVRFLILDLDLQIKEAKQGPKPPVLSTETAAAVHAPEADAGSMPVAPCGVSVEIDRLVKPGAMVSGTVVFSDGVAAGWMLDQYGRLALDAKVPDYRPSPEDVEKFQRALQEEIAKKGY